MLVSDDYRTLPVPFDERVTLAPVAARLADPRTRLVAQGSSSTSPTRGRGTHDLGPRALDPQRARSFGDPSMNIFAGFLADLVRVFAIRVVIRR